MPCELQTTDVGNPGVDDFGVYDNKSKESENDINR